MPSIQCKKFGIVIKMIVNEGGRFVGTLRKDFVTLQLHWWLFCSTKYCS